MVWRQTPPLGFLALVLALWGQVYCDQPDPIRSQSTAAFRTEVPETVAVAREGRLYIYGNQLEPPYIFLLEDDTLWVNGVQFIPAAGIQPSPKAIPSPLDTLQHELNSSVADLIHELLSEHVSHDSIVTLAAQTYLRSNLIDSLQVVEGTLVRYWLGGRGRPDYLPVPSRVPPPTPPFRDLLSGVARLYASTLRSGGMLIWSFGLSLSVPTGRTAECEEQIHALRQRGYATPVDRRRFRRGLRDLLDPIPLSEVMRR